MAVSKGGKGRALRVLAACAVLGMILQLSGCAGAGGSTGLASTGPAPAASPPPPTPPLSPLYPPLPPPPLPSLFPGAVPVMPPRPPSLPLQGAAPPIKVTEAGDQTNPGPAGGSASPPQQGASGGSSGSAGTAGSPGSAGLAAASDNAIKVRAWFATDRHYVGGTQYFDGKPNMVAPNLSYGSVLVSLPLSRAVGEIPRASWYQRYEANDAGKFALIERVDRLDPADFFKDLSRSLHDSGSKPAFVYIHGYNNSFTDAAMRAAQIAADINLPCVPVFYTWPSRARAQDYPTDEDSAAWTQSHLQRFLADFADRSRADRIYIIAHSMGNRPTVNALADLLEKRPELRPRFAQLILAAPDINAAVFREDIAPRFVRLATPVTVYASTNDKALRLSRDFHKWPRLGDMGPDAIGIEGIDLVDASKIATNFMGHDYTMSNRALLTDVESLMRDGSRARARSGLKGVPLDAPRYYAFP